MSFSGWGKVHYNKIKKKSKLLYVVIEVHYSYTSQATVHGKDRAKLIKACSSLYAKVVHLIMFLIASNIDRSLIFLCKCQEEIDKVS